MVAHSNCTCTIFQLMPMCEFKIARLAFVTTVSVMALLKFLIKKEVLHY